MNSTRLIVLTKTITFFIAFTLLHIDVKAQIDFEILSGDAQICAGDSTLLSIDAAVDSVTWTPSTGVSMPNSLSTFVTPMMGATYVATLYAGNATESVSFQVDIVSEANLGGNVSVCSTGSELNYDFTGLPFPGNYQMTSNINAIQITETSNNVFNINFANVPAGTFELAVINPVCNQSDTIEVEVTAGVAAELDFTEENRSICIGDEISLSVPTVAGQTYEWSANGTVLSNTNNVSDIPNASTTYVMSTVGTTCSVPTIDSVTITVNSDPAIALPESIAGCENDTIQLGNNIAQLGTTYTWAPTDNIVDPSAVNAALFVEEDGTYILTANNGCEIKDTVEVVMIDNDIDMVDTVFVCLGDQATINFTTSPPNDNVTWTTLDGAPLSNVPSPFVVNLDDGTSYVATLENMGCSFTDTVTVQVDSLPMNLDLTFAEYNNAPEPICVGDTVQITSFTFNEAFFPNIEYQWLVEGLLPSSGQSEFITPDSLFNVLFIAEETKFYNRVAQHGACIDTTEVEVPVVPILEIDVTPLDPVCPNSIVNLTGTATDPLNNNEVIDPADIEWEWMASSGTIEPAEGMGENTPTLTVQTSNVDIMVTATYEGCPAMLAETLPVLSTPSLGFPVITDICAGQEVSLNNGFLGPNYVFNWESTSNDLAGQQTSSNPIVMPTITTTYSVTVTNGVCEPVMDQVTINVFDVADGLTDPIEIGGCVGETGTLALPDSFNGGPGAVYTWTPQSGGTPLVGSSVQIQFFQDEIYIVTVSNNCEDDQFVGQALVTANALPNGMIILDPDNESYGEGEMISLSVEPNITGVEYTWESSNGAMFSNNPSPATTYTVPGGESDLITLTSNLNGCVSTDNENIIIVPAEVILPNIFTPGVSSTNDVDNSIFRLRVTGLAEITNLQIYDRWGNKVYDNDNAEFEWDGTINGNPAPSEVYIYTVTYQIPGQDPVTASSDLTLVR